MRNSPSTSRRQSWQDYRWRWHQQPQEPWPCQRQHLRRKSVGQLRSGWYPVIMRTFSTSYNSASVTHAPSRRSRTTGNEAHDGLGVRPRLVVLSKVLGGLFLHWTANLADQDDTCHGENRRGRWEDKRGYSSGSNVPSVLGSSRKTLMTSKWVVPGKGSPPIPTQRDWPSPTSVVCATASYVRVPERETMPTKQTRC